METEQGLFSELMGTAMRDADEAAEQHLTERAHAPLVRPEGHGYPEVPGRRIGCVEGRQGVKEGVLNED